MTSIAALWNGRKRGDKLRIQAARQIISAAERAGVPNWNSAVEKPAAGLLVAGRNLRSQSLGAFGPVGKTKPKRTIPAQRPDLLAAKGSDGARWVA